MHWLAYLAVVFGALALAATFALRPAWGVLAFAFLIPATVSKIQGHFFLPTLALASAAVGMTIRVALQGRLRRPEPTAALAAFGFAFYMILQVLLAMADGVSLRELNLLFFYLALPLFVLCLPVASLSEQRWERILNALAMGGMVYYSILLVTYLTAPEAVSSLDKSGHRRLLGFGGGHPAYVLSLTPVLTAGALFWLGARNAGKRVLGVLAMAVVIMAVMLGASRAAALSVGIVMMAGTVFLGQRSLGRLIIAVGFIAATFVFLGSQDMAGFVGRLQSLTADNLLLEIRWLSFLSAWDLFLHHPIIGVGLGKFPTIGLEGVLAAARDIGGTAYVSRVSGWLLQAPDGANSVYVGYLVETGLIGFALLLLLVSMALKRLVAHLGCLDGTERQALISLLIAGAAFLLHIATVNGETHPFLWFVVSLGFSPRCAELRIRRSGGTK